MIDTDQMHVRYLNSQTAKLTDNQFHEYIGFGIKDKIENDSLFIVYGEITRNEWNGGNRIQFNIQNVEVQSLLANSKKAV